MDPETLEKVKQNNLKAMAGTGGNSLADDSEDQKIVHEYDNATANNYKCCHNINI